MKQSDKKVSFDDPQNGGHFSCRKPVSHVGTSTVSDSEALIILLMCNIFGNQNLLLFWKAWPGGIELCSKIKAGKWLQMHFDMHVSLLETLLLCSSRTTKTFSNAPLNRKENGGWKMDLKNGARIWRALETGSTKWQRKRCAQYSFGLMKQSDKKGQSFDLPPNIGSPFWVPFLDPHVGGQILVSHFWDLHSSQTRPSLDYKNGPREFAKVIAVTLRVHSKTFTFNTFRGGRCMIKMDLFFSQLIASYNAIEASDLVKPSE